jgi:threonine dehydratase
VGISEVSPRSGYLPLMVTIADVEAARLVVDRHLRRSPLEHSPWLSRSLGCEIHLKLENARPTRSFKVRGALNRIAALDVDARRRGVVAASGGNHAQGVAYAAYVLGTSATVVMPEAVAPAIAEVCRAYGARVLLRGQIYDDTLALAHEIERDEGRTFVHPYEDPLVIAGQGTIGLEILEDLPDVETVLVPAGGGGVLCGIALAVKERASGAVRVIGVEPEGADNVARSVAAGAPVSLEAPRSIAERLVARSTGRLNVELARRYVDGFVTVSDDAIGRAVYEHFDRLSLLVEPSGAATLAALRSGAVAARGRMVLLVSGGNVPAPTLARILSEGQVPER